MFREMRRNKQQLSKNETKEIFKNNTSGVLALLSDDGFPYTVPISYVFTGDKLYFHSAKTGHKIDAINKYNKASFCVIAQDKVIPEKYTTLYKSAIAFGKIKVINSETEKLKALEVLAEKYTPNDEQGRKAEIEKAFDHLCMIEFTVEHMTGKQSSELAKK